MVRTIDVQGSRYDESLEGSVPFDANNRTASGANSPAVVTIAADPLRPIILSQIHCSYSATPTGGAITVEDGAGNTVWSLPLAGAGPFEFTFSPNLAGTKNTALVVTLAAAGGSVTGTLCVNARKHT